MAKPRSRKKTGGTSRSNDVPKPEKKRWCVNVPQYAGGQGRHFAGVCYQTSHCAENVTGGEGPLGDISPWEKRG